MPTIFHCIMHRDKLTLLTKHSLVNRQIKCYAGCMRRNLRVKQESQEGLIPHPVTGGRVVTHPQSNHQATSKLWRPPPPPAPPRRLLNQRSARFTAPQAGHVAQQCRKSRHPSALVVPSELGSGAGVGRRAGRLCRDVAAPARRPR